MNLQPLISPILSLLSFHQTSLTASCRLFFQHAVCLPFNKYIDGGIGKPGMPHRHKAFLVGLQPDTVYDIINIFLYGCCGYVRCFISLARYMAGAALGLYQRQYVSLERSFRRRRCYLRFFRSAAIRKKGYDGAHTEQYKGLFHANGVDALK